MPIEALSEALYANLRKFHSDVACVAGPESPTQVLEQEAGAAPKVDDTLALQITYAEYVLYNSVATVVRQATVTDASGNSLDVDALLDAANQR